MKKGQWRALGIVALGLPIGLVMVWFFYFHFVRMAPRSQDRDYYCVYWLENVLYYGSDCSKANLYLDTAVPGLIECREDPYLRFVNTRNGTSLLVEKPWDIQRRWLPSGASVFVDFSNGYVFWAKDGKVTDFVKLDPKLKAQLLESPPQSANHPRVTLVASPNPPGDDQAPRAGGAPTRDTPVVRKK